MYGVIAQQVSVGLDRSKVVDRHDFDIAALVLDNGAKDEAADAAKAVNGYAESHTRFFPLFMAARFRGHERGSQEGWGGSPQVVGGLSMKCPRRAATGEDRTSCQASTWTLAMRRPTLRTSARA